MSMPAEEIVVTCSPVTAARNGGPCRSGRAGSNSVRPVCAPAARSHRQVDFRSPGETLIKRGPCAREPGRSVRGAGRDDTAVGGQQVHNVADCHLALEPEISGIDIAEQPGAGQRYLMVTRSRLRVILGS